MQRRSRIRLGSLLSTGAALAFFPSAAAAQSPATNPAATPGDSAAVAAPAPPAAPSPASETPPAPVAVPPLPPAAPPAASALVDPRTLVVPGEGTWRYDPEHGWQLVGPPAATAPGEQEPEMTDPPLFLGGVVVYTLGVGAVGGAAMAAIGGAIPCAVAAAVGKGCSGYYTKVGIVALAGLPALIAGIPMMVIGGAAKDPGAARAVPEVRVGAGSVAATWSF